MSDEKRFFEEITPKAIAENGVVSLAIRPNQKSQYGTGGLSGKELQQRFDKLATLIISYYNEVAKALSSKEVLEYFKMPDETTLADFIKKITDDNYDIVSVNPYEGKEGKLSAIIQKFYINIEALAGFIQLSNYEKGKTLSDIFAKTTALKKAIEDHNKATDNHTDIRRDLDTVKAFLSSDDGTEAIDRLHELIALIRANAGTIDEIGKNKVNKDDIIRSYQALAGAGQDSVAGAKLLYDLFATKEDLKPFLSVEALTSALEPYAKDLRLGNTLKYLITNYQHAQTDIDGWIGREDTWVVSADQPINGIKNGDPLLFRCFNTTLNQYSYVFAKAVEDYASNNRIRALSTSVIHSGASTSGGIDKESIVTNLDDTSTDKVLAASVGALIKERIENAVKGLVSDKSLTEAIKGFVTEAVLDEAITSAVTDLVKRTDFDKTLANYALTTEVHNIVKDKITAADVGARPDTWTPSADEVGARPASWMPTATEVGAHPNTWIPTAEQVGARPDTWTPSASDVGARPNTWTPTYAEVGADKEGTASAAVSGHNTNSEAHNDIRLELKALADRIAAVLDSDDTTLDELSEIVAYIKSNKSLINSITTSKVNVADIINNLTSNVTNKPLSAAQGVALKGLYDALQQTVTALGNSKLDSSALTSAINTALSQAKESGEFDGENGTDGKTPYIKNGYWYIDGVNTDVKAAGVDGKDYVLTDADRKEIAGLVDETSTIPDYWKSELETKADVIQQAMEKAGRNKSAFLWYTDAHWNLNSKMSPRLLRYLIKNSPMNKVNFGGDIIGDPSPHNHANTKAMAYEWRKLIKDLPNHHSVYGNHDVAHWDSTKNDLDAVSKIAYAQLLASEESAEMVVGGDSYYYIDDSSEKTRYLYLSYLTSDHSAMTAQGVFIVNALKSVAEGWHIVVIAHRWYQYVKNNTTGNYDITGGSIPTYEADILSVLDAYNAKTTRGTSNYFASQNFSDAKGKVEFCIGGHLHYDYDFRTSGGIPVIITAADANQERSSNENEDSGTLGTTTESAVYGIIADYNDPDATKITVVGVGRGCIDTGGSRVVRPGAIKPISISNLTYSGDTTVGTTIDKSKFSFTVKYSNGNTEVANGAASVSPTKISAVGNNTVTITYTEGDTTVSGTATIVGTAIPTYTITNNLTNCKNSNSATTVNKGASYNATITANTGYSLDSVKVTMGGSNVSVTNGVISISNVTGAIVITATAVANALTNEILTSVDTDETTKYNGTGYALNQRLGSDGTIRTGASGCVASGLMPYNGQDIELVIPTTAINNSNTYLHTYIRYNSAIKAIVPFKLSNGTQVDGSHRQINYWVNEWGVTYKTVGSTTVLTIPASTIVASANGNAIDDILYLRVSSVIDSGVTVNASTLDSTFRLSFLPDW